MKLSYDQAQNLHKAIDLAKGATECAYARGGEPFCVIGQFAVLEGIDIAEIKTWRKVTVDHESIPNFGLPRRFLAKIQVAWDEGHLYESSEDTRKAAMHAIVNEAQGVELEE